MGFGDVKFVGSFGVPMETAVYEAPSVESFELPPIFESVPWFDKFMLQAILATILIAVFWLVMSRKNKLVPTRSQFLAESFYNVIRNGIARDLIGHDFRRYLPYLIALFSFILVNNLFGVFPLTLMPTAAHIGWAYGLAILTWVIYNGVGIAKHGLGGYVKRTVLPSGVPWPLWFLIIPLEFLSNIIVRPVTLSLRLFGNMFAGHLVIMVFVLGGEFLLLHGGSIINHLAGGVSLIFSLGIFSLETMVQIIQAYVFTVLTAQYISSAVAEEH